MNSYSTLWAVAMLFPRAGWWLFKRLIDVLTSVLVLVFIVHTTPFWIFELLFSFKGITAVCLASGRNCETFFDWAFSRVNPDQQMQHMNFVRLWGLEFQYR